MALQFDYLNAEKFMLITATDLIEKLESNKRLKTNDNESKENLHELSKIKITNTTVEQLKHIFNLIETKGLSKEVTELDISNCRLKEVPSEIGSLINLEVLSLGENHLRKLPSEIINLKALKKLCLDENYIKEFPAEICKLVTLEQLLMYNNKLRALPSEIGSLISLVVLSLGRNNFLKELPSEIVNLKALKELYFDRNNIKVLPSEICKLVGLSKLILNKNKLKVLPPEFADLKDLEELDLSENKFHIFPSEICKLPMLKKLNLDCNQLKGLHPKIYNLKALDTLSVKFNYLAEFIPAAIGNMISLKSINLEDKDTSKQLRQLKKAKVYSDGDKSKKGIPSSLFRLANLTKLKYCDVFTRDFFVSHSYNIKFPEIFSQDGEILSIFQQKWQKQLILLHAQFRVLFVKLREIFPDKIGNVIIGYYETEEKYSMYKSMKLSPDLKPEIVQLVESSTRSAYDAVDGIDQML